MFSLPGMTLVRFAGWNAAGFLLYLLYGRRRSLAGHTAPATANS
ncbi:amino acid permease C-terminal domain-containing protein [Sphingomonas quercus]